MFDINRLLPHQPPMLLIDDIIEADAKRLVAIKKLKTDDLFVQGHYPGYPLFPGALTCECLFQAGAAFLSLRLQSYSSDKAAVDPKAVPIITRIRSAKFKEMIRPPADIILKVELLEEVSHAFYMRGRAEVGERLSAVVDFTCAQATLAGVGA